MLPSASPQISNIALAFDLRGDARDKGGEDLLWYFHLLKCAAAVWSFSDDDPNARVGCVGLLSPL